MHIFYSFRKYNEFSYSSGRNAKSRSRRALIKIPAWVSILAPSVTKPVNDVVEAIEAVAKPVVGVADAVAKPVVGVVGAVVKPINKPINQIQKTIHWIDIFGPIIKPARKPTTPSNGSHNSPGNTGESVITNDKPQEIPSQETPEEVENQIGQAQEKIPSEESPQEITPNRGEEDEDEDEIPDDPKPYLVQYVHQYAMIVL